ncbi:hypothetical protein C8Q78DRAFT_569355 [Trametes maxima]|nr:hypothetical protein C8Q78DRAFT_569355 [Trametes maxima]
MVYVSPDLAFPVPLSSSARTNELIDCTSTRDSPGAGAQVLAFLTSSSIASEVIASHSASTLISVGPCTSIPPPKPRPQAECEHRGPGEAGRQPIRVRGFSVTRPAAPRTARRNASISPNLCHQKSARARDFERYSGLRYICGTMWRAIRVEPVRPGSAAAHTQLSTVPVPMRPSMEGYLSIRLHERCPSEGRGVKRRTVKRVHGGITSARGIQDKDMRSDRGVRAIKQW